MSNHGSRAIAGPPTIFFWPAEPSLKITQQYCFQCYRKPFDFTTKFTIVLVHLRVPRWSQANFAASLDFSGCRLVVVMDPILPCENRRY